MDHAPLLAVKAPHFCLLAVLTTGCFDYSRAREIKVAPPPKPSKAAPFADQELPPLSAGLGRLLIDCLNTSCSVQDIKSESTSSASSSALATGPGGIATASGSAYGYGKEARMICEDTPCRADLPPGNYTLHLQSKEGCGKTYYTRDLADAPSGKTLYCEKKTIVNVTEGWHTVLLLAPPTRRVSPKGDSVEASESEQTMWSGPGPQPRR